MEIGQIIRHEKSGMTITSANSIIRKVWEIKSINDSEKTCECYLRSSNEWVVSGESIDILSFEFVNKYKQSK